MKKILLMLMLAFMTENVFAEGWFDKKNDEKKNEEEEKNNLDNENGVNKDSKKINDPSLPPDHPCQDPEIKEIWAGRGVNTFYKNYRQKVD